MTVAPGSRYASAEQIVVACHTYDANGIMITTDTTGDPALDDFEHRNTLYALSTSTSTIAPTLTYQVHEGETIQFLADRFMSDPTRWWDLANANLDVFWYPLDMKMGDTIYLP
jgi:hypothetical protein